MEGSRTREELTPPTGMTVLWERHCNALTLYRIYMLSSLC